jgi:hypothetical protein
MKFLIKKILSIASFAVLISSCTKDVLDINTDPNNATTASATPDLVLPAAMATTGAIFNNPTSDNRFAFAGIWMGHIGYSGNYAITTENLSYNITTNFGSGTFANLYDNINDYEFVESKGRSNGNNFFTGIGKLMKVYDYQALVDLYGNVPYFEAMKGTAISTPKYDDGKAVYEDLNKQVDTSIALFKTSVSGSISGDIMFSGKTDQWLAFANSIKLRLLLRQSQKADRASYIQAEAAKLTGAVFLTKDAGVNPGYSNSTGKQNPFYGSNINTSGTYTQDFYRAGQYSVAFFKAHKDPRIAKFYDPAATGGDFQGNYFGEQGLVNSKTSTFGSGILKSVSQASILMLAAESYFEQAEGVVRGYIKGNAKTLYQSGVEASFIYLGLTAADAKTYYTQASDKEVNWDATAGAQEQIALIIRQKWAALTLINELEVYNDYRRLGLPADVPLSRSPFSTGKLPARLLYPQREYEVNASNVPTVTPNDKVWWMP